MTPDDVCGSNYFGKEYTAEEVRELWPGACGELLGFAKHLDARAGITAVQLRMACRLAQEAFDARKQNAIEPKEETPIPMILNCPACNAQHIDKPAPDKGWTNPPHRSHLCKFCGIVWRPADVPTIGVAKIETRGGSDTWPVPEDQDSGTDEGLVVFYMSDAMAKEATRVIAMTDLSTLPELFRRAFTLLRIHIDAAVRNLVVVVGRRETVKTTGADDKQITLPFKVKK